MRLVFTDIQVCIEGCAQNLKCTETVYREKVSGAHCRSGYGGPEGSFPKSTFATSPSLVHLR